MFLVCKYIVDVCKLLGNEDLGVLLFHLQCTLEALVDALSDIAVVVDELYLGTIVTDELTAFFADGITIIVR